MANVFGYTFGLTQQGSLLNPSPPSNYTSKLIDKFGSHIIGLWGLQEESGTTAIDSSGKNNSAALVGTITHQQSGIESFKSTKIIPSGATGGINLYSSGFNSLFSGAEGFVNMWVKADANSSWITNNKTLFTFYVDENNQIVFKVYTDAAGTSMFILYYIAGGVNKSISTIPLYGTRFWNLGIRWSKSNDALDIFINGVKQKTVSGLGTWVGTLDASSNYAASGKWAENTFPGYFSHVMLLDYAPIDADILSVINPNGVICFEGDSRSNSKPWPANACEILYPKSIYGAGLKGIANMAVTGETTAQIAARAANTNAKMIAGKQNTLVYFAGVNDGDSVSAQTTYDNIKAYLIAARSAGWSKIILCTEIDAQDTGRSSWHNSQWPAINALITADHSFADAVADLGARPELQDATNTTYYLSDKLHLTPAGYAVIGEEVGYALRDMIQPELNSEPTDITLSANTIPEQSVANTIIGALTTTDPDAGNKFTYELVAGYGDNASFNISGANVRNTDVFDFQTKSSYSIKVRSIDQLGASFDKIFTITVTFVDENVFMTATGGNITTDGDYKVHTFNSSGTFEVTRGGTVKALIIGGGGGGGTQNNGAGGGGAGGYIENDSVSVSEQAYNIVVGAGGAKSTSSSASGSNGNNSSAFGLTALGGGGGAHEDTLGSNGGSGGGGGGKTSAGAIAGGTASQGSNGGSGIYHSAGSYRAGGGGGGAGAVGGNATVGVAGVGGTGLASSITGSSVTRAGGGGGSSIAGSGAGGSGGGGNGNGNTGNAQSGTANTGGGGGAAATYNGYAAGDGGSGVVIVRYKFQ